MDFCSVLHGLQIAEYSVTLDEFINIVNNYIKWYNETRIKQTLGYKSLIENIR